jgi:hypothetical protein
VAEKQKPQYDVVKRAAKILKDPSTATQEDARRMAARILDDEKNDPDPNRTTPKPTGRR